MNKYMIINSTNYNNNNNNNDNNNNNNQHINKIIQYQTHQVSSNKNNRTKMNYELLKMKTSHYQTAHNQVILNKNKR